jgi:SOS-response transcriptional repressor LexA
VAEPNGVIEDKDNRLQVEIPNTYIPQGAPNYMAFMVRGSSMKPQIMNDDIVLIYKTSEWDKVENLVCAVRVDGGITLKRVKFDHTKRSLLLEPINIDYPTLILDHDQTRDVYLLGTLAVQLRVYV